MSKKNTGIIRRRIFLWVALNFVLVGAGGLFLTNDIKNVSAQTCGTVWLDSCAGNCSGTLCAGAVTLSEVQNGNRYVAICTSQ